MPLVELAERAVDEEDDDDEELELLLSRTERTTLPLELDEREELEELVEFELRLTVELLPVLLPEVLRFTVEELLLLLLLRFT